MEVSIRASEKICIPTVALRGMVILPRTIIHFDLSCRAGHGGEPEDFFSDAERDGR